MYWIGTGLTAISVLLAAAIASLIIRKWKNRRVLASVVLFVSFFILHGFSRSFLFPYLNALYQSRKAGALLIEIPAFRAIKQYDSPLYYSLLNDFGKMVALDMSESKILETMHSRIMTEIEKRLIRSSDREILSYMAMTIAKLNELTVMGGDTCYCLINPRPTNPNPINYYKYISRKTQGDEYLVFRQILQASEDSSKTVPTFDDIKPFLLSVYQELEAKYGSDLLMLVDSSEQVPDKRKVCLMTSDLYSRILRLPDSQGAKVFRYFIHELHRARAT